MSKNVKIAGAVSAVALLATAAWAAPGGDRAGKLGDANGDGVVTQAEMTAAAAQRFARMDANNDGVLNESDRAARKERRAENMATRFAAMDTDSNGEISKAEMDAHHAAMKAKMPERMANMKPKREFDSSKMFAMMDADNSGGISMEEMQAVHGERSKMHKMRADRMKDGEAKGMRGHRGGGMKMMAKAADTNNDGSVSKAEFTEFAAARFAKADTNNDGQVSAEERSAARDAMRAKWKAAKEAGSAN
jgi:hypothetical protein